MVLRRIAVLSVLLLAIGAVPAEAGGPTSVLLSAPPRVVAVGYEDRAYDELQRLTDVAGSRELADTENHAVGNFVRATWLIHDMTVWRIDIIYPDAPGGPWIATSDYMSGSKPTQPTWHTATDRVALLRVLDSLKLLNGGLYDGGPTTIDSTPFAAPEPTQPAPAPVATSGPFTGWRWTIPGFLLGVVVAVVAVRYLPKRRDWELIDTE